jgi:hypothetical protein
VKIEKGKTRTNLNDSLGDKIEVFLHAEKLSFATLPVKLGKSDKDISIEISVKNSTVSKRKDSAFRS